MLIVSKFHDYYDSVMKTGVDKSLVYKRSTEEVGNIKLTRTDRFEKVVNRYQVREFGVCDLSIVCTPVIFCGEYHERFVGSFSYTRPDGLGLRELVTLTGSSRSVVMEKIRSRFNLEELPQRKLGFFRESLDREFDVFIRTRDWVQLHREHDSPILSFRYLTTQEMMSRPTYQDRVSTYVLIKNPSLKNLGFQEIFPPYEAYQRISEFLGGVVGQKEKQIVKLPDKDLVKKHGFDKWSFRKTPEIPR